MNESDLYTITMITVDNGYFLRNGHVSLYVCFILLVLYYTSLMFKQLQTTYPSDNWLWNLLTAFVESFWLTSILFPVILGLTDTLTKNTLSPKYLMNVSNLTLCRRLDLSYPFRTCFEDWESDIDLVDLIRRLFQVNPSKSVELSWSKCLCCKKLCLHT